MSAPADRPPLLPCRDCGHRVSTRAPYCPSCGAPNPSGNPAVDHQLERMVPAKTLRIALGVAIGLLLLGALPALVFLILLAMGIGIAGASP